MTAQNTTDEQNLLVTFALGEYLAELRDNKVGVRPPFPSKEITISESDLQRFPFDEFLRQRYPSEATPKGYLKVESVPTGAEIKIDSEYKGTTDKPFVIRPGQHQVSVSSSENSLSCTETVSVQRDKTAIFRCPRK